MIMEKRVIVTIGGSDPSGGAGIQADIRTAERLGLYPCSVITAVTSQNSSEVKGIWETSESPLKSQLECVFSDFRSDAVKIGLTPSPEVVRIIGEALREYDAHNIVVDPVLSTSLNPKNPEEEIVKAMEEYFFPIATLLTPNIPEKDTIEKVLNKSMEEICDAFLLKGGHSDSEKEITDTLYFKELVTPSAGSPSTAFPTLNFNHSSLYDYNSSLPADYASESKWEKRQFTHKRIETSNTHGTGCVLSTAIASYLAQGFHLERAVYSAIKFSHEALLHASKFKITKGSYGPSLI